ncbi:hypothetical protein [Listeria booriae]|nr:hypothetical protein [Listeria booriae]
MNVELPFYQGLFILLDVLLKVGILVAIVYGLYLLRKISKK